MFLVHGAIFENGKRKKVIGPTVSPTIIIIPRKSLKLTGFRSALEQFKWLLPHLPGKINIGGLRSQGGERPARVMRHCPGNGL